MEPVRTLRVLEKYVSQAVFLLFVTRVLLFSHVAVDCFFRKFRKFRSYLFLASAEDDGQSVVATALVRVRFPGESAL